MARAWDKEKNLSSRRESNPRPPVQKSITLMSFWLYNLYHFITELRIHHHLQSLSFTTTTSTLLFLAVCRTRVIHELSLMASLSISSCGSVDRAPSRCTGGHWFDSCRGLRFFSCPTLVSCWLYCLYHLDRASILIFCDVAISHNWPQIATFRIIRQKSHHSGKIAKFDEKVPWAWYFFVQEVMGSIPVRDRVMLIISSVSLYHRA